jgi:diguanylate cyclase (GGDEF)-like protein
MILALLAILVIANVVLLGANPLRARFARRLQHQAVVVAGPSGGARSGAAQRTADARATTDEDHRASADEDDRAAAAIEAFIEQVSPRAGAVAPPLTRSPAAPARPEPITVPAPEADLVPSISSQPPRPSALKWIPAGLADLATWDRTIRDESARAARFGRPATVVMAELHHLDDLAERLGPDVADRVVTETARLLVREGRAADRIAWLGDATFGVLLLETGEFEARGYVNRVRSAADRWLESAGLSVRLSLGWASPGEGGDVRAAAATAQGRMQDAGHDSGDEADADAPRGEEVLIRVSRRRSPRPVS